jgi:hypothetical protein
MFALIGRHIWLLGLALAPVVFAAKLAGAVIA